jgi:hypothetical protein
VWLLVKVCSSQYVLLHYSKFVQYNHQRLVVVIEVLGLRQEWEEVVLLP